jgi:integrase
LAKRPAQIEKNFRTKRDAEDWIATQRAAVLTGTHIAPSRAERRFVDLIEAWRESWAAKGLEPQTTRRYEQVLRVHVAPTLGHRRANTLTHEAIQRYMDGLRRGGMTPGTLHKVHTVLSAIFKKAVKMGSVSTNPCYAIELPPVESREMVILTPAEIMAVAHGVLDEHWQPAIYTAAYTGVRAAEQWAITRRDIDPLRGTLRIEKAMLADCSIGPTKTHERRTITPNAKLTRMLEDHLALRPGGTKRWPAVRRDRAGWDLYSTEDWQHPDRLAFLTPRGTPVRHNLVHKRQFKPAVRDSLPPDKQLMRWLDFRHTHASLLIHEGATPVLVSKRLGHKSTQMTLDTYAHLYPSAEAALSKTLDEVFTTEAPPSNVEVLHGVG